MITIKTTMPAPMTRVGQLVRDGDVRYEIGSGRRERSGAGAGLGGTSFGLAGRFAGCSDGIGGVAAASVCSEPGPVAC